MRVANKRAVSGWFVAVMLAAVTVALAPGAARSHGDVNPQPVDTKGLKPIGDEWKGLAKIVDERVDLDVVPVMKTPLEPVAEQSP